jgi:hypothetical protein
MDRWVLDNIKSALTLLLPIGLIFVIFFNLPKILKTVHTLSFDAETYGILDTVLQHQGIQESFQGGKIVAMSFQIKYHYQVKQEKYVGVAYLYRNMLSDKEKLLLNKFKSNDTVFIKYKAEKPSQSILIVDKSEYIPSSKIR